jgi:predicted alpha/beta superfamily hydrolase
MKKIQIVILFFSTALCVNSQNIIHFEIKSLPQNNPSSSAIYIAGSFNGWNPQNEQYRFQKDEKGNYFLNLKLNTSSYEYKITRGGWDKVECNKNGAAIANRSLEVSADITVELSVEEWQDNFKAKPKISTATRHVYIADTAFWIPQLKRPRRIIVYLPDDYQKRRYPVLYMHDGQNLFDDSTSFAGEWGVDEYLDSVKMRKCIVIGIDNLSSKRLNEYCPYDFTLDPKRPNANKGEGRDYVDFIVNTLKPYIDKKYRTLKNKEHTFIAGGSMGGLISLYAVLRYPKVFGGAGIFSPSVWICKTQLLNLIDSVGSKVKSNLYFYCGKKESESMVPDMLRVFEEMQSVSKTRMTTLIRDDGKHNEPTWRKEFPLFYEWLLH